jgi:peptide methionine sulfoxide reductase MsrB
MNYNHITYGQQKIISPKKTEATATGIDGDFITRESICRHCDTPFYRSGYTFNAGYGLPRYLYAICPNFQGYQESK